MITISVSPGGYNKIIEVNMTEPDFLKMSEECSRLSGDHVLTYSSRMFNGKPDAMVFYNKTDNRIEYTGGRVYVGLGPALGWEIALQVGMSIWYKILESPRNVFLPDDEYRKTIPIERS